MAELNRLSARDVAAGVATGALSAEACVAATFERLHALEETLHAFVTLDEARALAEARAIDARVRRGEHVGRLAGVSVAVKDNICTRFLPTTCASRILTGFTPPYNATVVDRLRQADAVIIGKTNMDEFAMGTSTETSCFGPTRNPWDRSRVPGGSSGGSAAAIAADEATLALGSDTGGSVRCPASFCSVVGLKPTYGLVSRYGLIAYANSLEQIGPLTGDVSDCASMLSVIAGHDPKDSTSLPSPRTDYPGHLVDDVAHLRVGIPREFFGDGVDPLIEDVVRRGIRALDRLGAECREVTIPTLRYALASYYLIAMSEASSNLARYDGLRYGYANPELDADWSATFSRNRRDGFGAEVKRRIILGTYALSAGYYDRYYLKALQIRTLLQRDFERIFANFDVVAGPTMPVPPFLLGEKLADPLSLYMCDALTIPVNLTGHPALSVPCGFSNGLPVGLQLMAPALREDVLLRVAYAFERQSGMLHQTPAL